MKNALISYSKHGPNDEYLTPFFAISPLLKYIPDNKVIWCPFDKETSNYVKALQDAGHKVIHTHIDDGYNFFNYVPEQDFDIIISNPPYSIKTDVLKRCYELNKPFALLLPITTLEGAERSKLFSKYGIELIILDRRVNFMNWKNNVHKKNCWFNSSYFCWKLLPKQLIFERLIENDNKQLNLNFNIKNKKL